MTKAKVSAWLRPSDVRKMDVFMGSGGSMRSKQPAAWFTMAKLDQMMDKFVLMALRQPPRSFLAGRIKRGRYLFLNMPPGRVRPAVICTGWEECHPDFAIERPSFSYEAVELLAGGEWEVRVGRKHRRCGPGILVVYGPGKPCSIKTVGRGPHWKYFFDLAGALSHELIADCGLAGRGVFACGESPHIAQLFEQILSCSDLHAGGRNATVCALVEAVLRRAGASRLPSRKYDSRSAQTFNRCRAHLETHYPEIESMAAAARACHVSVPYFSRLFRRHVGMTAERFLMSLRVNHAARLLQQTSLSVKEAGVKVGFKDPYHFSRAFKHVHGKAPRDFR